MQLSDGPVWAKCSRVWYLKQRVWSYDKGKLRKSQRQVADWMADLEFSVDVDCAIE